MASTEQVQLSTCITGTAPKPDATLCGYVVMAEWMEPGGKKFLTRLVGDHTSSWAAKGYMHEGLFAEWPAPLMHHNAGN